ncbi:MAG: DUF222 domain-containing protein [Angustibacter sp.]
MTDTVDTSGGAGALAAVTTAVAGLEQLAGAAFWQLPDADLTALAAALDRVRRLADGQTVRLLGEVESRGLPGQDGTGSPAAWLRRIVPSMRPGEAAGFGKQAHTLYRSVLSPDLEPTRAALETGTVRVCQARVVTDLVDQLSPPNVPVDGPDALDPEHVATAQVMLLDDATRLPAPDLAKCAVAIRHHLDPGADERLARDEKAQHRQRCLTLTPEASGMYYLQGALTKEAGNALRTAIDAWSAPEPASDGTPDPRSPGQRRHDALHRLAQTALATNQVPTSHGSPAKVIVRVSAETLATAICAPDEKTTGLPPAELEDGTPISRRLLARLACGADLTPVLIDDLGDPLDVGRTHRYHTPRQRIALIERDRHCTFEDCTAPASWCDAHHLTPWEHGGHTTVRDGALLCDRHHHHVHTTGATGKVVNGQVIWTPPGSPPPGDQPPPPPPDPNRWQRRYLQRLTRPWLVQRRE